MTSTNRQMTMVAFLQAQNCSNLPGSWRHPASMSDFLTPDYYQRIARTNMLHTDFPGRLCREGNMAFPFSPSDIPMGPVYRFSIYHVLELDDPREIFPISYEEV